MLWLPCAVRVSWIDRPHGRSRNINHTNSTSLSFIIRSETDTWTKKSSKPENTFFLTFTSGRLFGQMNLTSEFSAASNYAWKVKVLYCSTAKVKVGEPINNDVRQRVLNKFLSDMTNMIILSHQESEFFSSYFPTNVSRVEEIKIDPWN